MDIHELRPTDQPLVEALLRENPHKIDQIRFQKLDIDRLVRFHTTRIMSRVDKPDQPIWAIDSSGGPGLLGLQAIKSHSDFFEKLVFSMSPVLSYKLNEPDRALLLEKGVETARVKGADVVWMQFAEEESEWFSLLSRENGAYCGTDLRLSLRLKPGSDEDSQETRLRPASREDLELLEKIAARGHRNSHFFRDPFLDEKKKERLFPEYLRKSFGSESRTLWVAEDRNELMGFTLLIEPTNQEESIGRRVGILDYIVVDPKFQGRGVGKALLKKSHNHLASKGFEFVELKTMLDNRSAVNFYQREGYRLVSSEVHFSLGM